MKDELQQINNQLDQQNDIVQEEVEEILKNSTVAEIHEAFVEGNYPFRGLIAYYIYENFEPYFIKTAKYAIDNDLNLSYRLLAAIPPNSSGLDELIHKSLNSSHYMNIETGMGMAKRQNIEEFRSKIQALLQHPDESVSSFAAEILGSGE